MLKAQGAMAALLKDAIRPNLVQTLEGTPAVVHGGPFANIAHGCNSVLATRMALKIGDYAVTEAGFGADLGAEKFIDIKCRLTGLKPSAVVVVATVRALKMHGGISKQNLSEENVDALKKGLPNLIRHISNIRNVFHLPAVVAVNRFPTDTDAEIREIMEQCRLLSVNVVLSEVWARGGEGGIDLANEVVRLCEQKSDLTYCYELNQSIEEKIQDITQRIYGGKKAVFSAAAKKQVEELTAIGMDKLPVCIAKTQYSFSDNKALIGAPEDFEISITEVRVSAGAGFIVASAGDIMIMPGLPKIPSAEKIDVSDDGVITGLF